MIRSGRCPRQWGRGDEPPSDADLLVQVAAGDERALRELVERHSAWLLLRLRRRTGDEELAAVLMVRHAARAVPWVLVAVASLVTVVLLGAVRYDHWTLWPLQGTAVGLLAAAVGWCLDEPAAAVVDAAPRGLAWRTLARGAGIGVLLAAWSAGVWWGRAELFGHPWAVFGQGLAAAVVGVAWVTWRRAGARRTPASAGPRRSCPRPRPGPS